MKIKHVDIDWHPGFANAATFIVTVEGEWSEKGLRYEQRGDCYFGHLDGTVRFFAYSSPGRGYGGHAFNIQMMDGTEKKLIGPWSSRSSVMNKLGFEPSTEARIIDDRYSCIGGAVTIKALTSFLKAHPELNIKVIKTVDSSGEISYHPAEVQPDGSLKAKLWSDEAEYIVVEETEK